MKSKLIFILLLSLTFFNVDAQKKAIDYDSLYSLIDVIGISREEFEYNNGDSLLVLADYVNQIHYVDTTDFMSTGVDSIMFRSVSIMLDSMGIINGIYVDLLVPVPDEDTPAYVVDKFIDTLYEFYGKQMVGLGFDYAEWGIGRVLMKSDCHFAEFESDFKFKTIFLLIGLNE